MIICIVSQDGSVAEWSGSLGDVVTMAIGEEGVGVRYDVVMTSEVVANLVTKGEAPESAGLLGEWDGPALAVGGQVQSVSLLVLHCIDQPPTHSQPHTEPNIAY